ncbi:threonine synthase [Maritalea sp. S77]|uniref:threonine synthase n=1 Tax=Maritalea sp. S77 TaxID=3415125 RepID=UPI003C7BEBE3
MQYISTRGDAPRLGFCDAVLAGLARDGGLYLPESWPQFSSEQIAAMANRPFADIAFEVISPFVDGEIADEKLREMLDAAYGTFRHDAVAPLVQIEPGHFVLELFHGPTLAFKDVAMQFLARVMDHILGERNQRATIVGATSGDTGSAAIEAFRGRDNTDIFILHPKGMVSPVQQRQMTTVLDENVFNIALEGNFDDCQTIVKDMFNNHHFRDSVLLSGVNSINWGRIVAQVVYYFTAAAALGAPHRQISFTVPTGNFGDVFAGYVAKRMGLPIKNLIIATNENDILRRTLDEGRYEMDGVSATTSPSMDIQISSNFERLLFEAAGRDAELVKRQMAQLKQSGGFELTATEANAIRAEFKAGTADQAQTEQVQAHTLSHSGYLLDPHTAVAVAVAKNQIETTTPMVSLSTAHPAKFPAAVKAATQIDPALPEWLSDLYEREERYEVIANSQSEVENFIKAHCRANKEL